MTNRNYHSCFIFQHAWRCPVSQCRKCREEVAICFSSRSYSPSNDLFRIFWLDVLQKSRRSCNSSTEKLSLKSSVSQKVWVLFFPTTLFTFTLWKITEGKIRIFWWLNSIFKQNSLAECEDKMTNFSDAKDLQTPMSAGYLYKKTFFQTFPNKNRFKLTRSESERRLPPAKFERTDSGLTGGN